MTIWMQRLLALIGAWMITTTALAREPVGSKVQLGTLSGQPVQAYVAGPPNAKAGVLVLHDWFGLSEATRAAVDRLGRQGFRAVAVDLYGGRSATDHDEAGRLMAAYQSLPPAQAEALLKTGIDYLREQPGRRIATLGFSMGAAEALRATLANPNDVHATALVYGFGFDAVAAGRLPTLRGPGLAIVGARDAGSLDASLTWLRLMNEAQRSVGLLVVPDVDHAYMQPLFNGGKNFSKVATHRTWEALDDFLTSTLRADPGAGR